MSLFLFFLSVRPPPGSTLTDTLFPSTTLFLSVMRSVGGEFVKGDPELLTREVLGVVVAGMSMVNVLPRLTESAIVVIPADRTEVLLATLRSEEHTSELQSLMRISYAVFCLKKKKTQTKIIPYNRHLTEYT